ncbi:hypothetical protein EJB05_07613, partial [Eragrostis curvula]
MARGLLVQLEREKVEGAQAPLLPKTSKKFHFVLRHHDISRCRVSQVDAGERLVLETQAAGCGSTSAAAAAAGASSDSAGVSALAAAERDLTKSRRRRLTSLE